jgi:hypothetical protein
MDNHAKRVREERFNYSSTSVLCNRFEPAQNIFSEYFI